MCEYHLNGFTNREIAAVLDMHEVTIGMVLRSPAARAYCEERLGDLNTQFNGQFAKVLETFQEAFRSESIDVRIKAADMWLKSHGRYQPKREEEKHLTVEDVIAKLLKSGGGSVHVAVSAGEDGRIAPVDPPKADDFSFLERAE